MDEDRNNIHDLDLGDGLTTWKDGGFEISGINGDSHKAKLIVDFILSEGYYCTEILENNDAVIGFCS